MEKMATWEIALRRLEMPVSRFLLVYVGGAAFAGFVVALIAIFLTGGFSDGALFAGFAGAFLLFIMPAMAGLAAASFPLAGMIVIFLMAWQSGEEYAAVKVDDGP